MKYFMRMRPGVAFLKMRPDNMDGDAVYEVTRERALFYYRLFNKNVRGGGELLAKPQWQKGQRVSGGFYEVWGENISNKELFRRRLTGDVAKEVVEK